MLEIYSPPFRAYKGSKTWPQVLKSNLAALSEKKMKTIKVSQKPIVAGIDEVEKKLLEIRPRVSKASQTKIDLKIRVLRKSKILFFHGGPLKFKKTRRRLSRILTKS